MSPPIPSRAARIALVMPLLAAFACSPAAPTEPPGDPSAGSRGPSQMVAGDACPAGREMRSGECVLPEPEDQLPVAVDPAASAPGPRDPRRSRPPRSPRLVATEVRQLKALLDTTPQTSPEIPLILRRIAEDYAEIAAGTSGEARANARRASIEAYERLARDFPEQCGQRRKECVGEAHYYLALELELARDFDKARRTYLELVKTYPQSAFVPYAYFAFGELFFEEGAADPSKLPLAKMAFEQATHFEDSPIAPHGLLRLGELSERMGEKEKAALYYKKLRASYPGTAAAESVPEWMK